MGIKMATLSFSFLARRLHSLLGLFIVLFLIEHLVTNSQAALLFGEDGAGFVRAVNFIKNLPYLPFIEIFLLGVPILFHMVWGIKYLLTAKTNDRKTDGSKPNLKGYRRNKAYTWQRITSWILLFGIILHVGFMRFYMYPTKVKMEKQTFYLTHITMDTGLEGVAKRLGVQLYDKEEIQDSWIKKENIFEGEVIAKSPDFGTATLLNVRDSFKSVFKASLYTVFVLAAVFHAFNGLWSFMVSWGVVLKARSQSQAVNFCVMMMVLIGLLGLFSIWGTYFINLRY